MEGVLHVYHPSRSLLLFEHVPRPRLPLSDSSSTTAQPLANTLLFIGGMFDNFSIPGYTTDLAALFSCRSKQTWSVMHIQLSSAGRSFGTSSLDKDIEEIAVAVQFIRSTLRPQSQKSSTPSPVILIGHSTGCQGVLHYLYSANPLAPNRPSRPVVQGGILQAPASDRDGMLDGISKDPHVQSLYQQAIDIAARTPTQRHRDTLLPLDLTTPLLGPAPMCVSRFLSLASPGSPSDPGPDDLFSHDLTDERLQSTFGVVGERGLLQPASSPSQSSSRADTAQSAIPTPSLLALHSAQDEYIPSYIDKAALIGRWADAMRATGSKAVLNPRSTVIEGGNHGLTTWWSSPPSSSSSSQSPSPTDSKDPPDERGEGEEVEHGTWARIVTFRGIVLEYLDEVVGYVAEDAWDVWRKDRDKLSLALELEEKKEQDNDDDGDDGGGGDTQTRNQVEKGMKNVKL